MPDKRFHFGDVLGKELRYIDCRRKQGTDPLAADQIDPKVEREYKAKALRWARRRWFAAANAMIERMRAAQRAAAASLSNNDESKPLVSVDINERIAQVLQQADEQANRAAEAKCAEEIQARRQNLEESERRNQAFYAGAEAIAAGESEIAGDVAPARDPVQRAAAKRWREFARGKNLLGLALSGGGIRSATFNLGLLQGLADLGLLKRFDYLSTVSGGGYIGSWLAAWIHRESSILSVERQLRNSRVKQADGRTSNPAVSQEEPDPILHLRSYSNYLAPRLGLGSADTWVLLAIYLRNLILNLLMLVPAVLALLLLPRLLLLFYHWDGTPIANIVRYAVLVGTATLWVIGAVATGGALVRLRRGVAAAAASADTPAADAPPPPAGQAVPSPELGMRPWGLMFYILLPFLLASVLANWFSWDDLWAMGNDKIEHRNVLLQYVERLPLPAQANWPRARNVILFGVAAAALFGIPYLLRFAGAFVIGPWKRVRTGTWQGFVRPFQDNMVWRLLAALGGGLLAGGLLGLVYQVVNEYWKHKAAAPIDKQALQAAMVLTFGPSGMLLIYYLGTVLWIGFMGQRLEDPEREWWASLSGNILKTCVLMFLLFGLALFGVPLMIWAGPRIGAAVASGWVVTTLGGILAGTSRFTGKGRNNLAIEVFTRVAPYVFLVGLFIAAAWLECAIVDSAPKPATFQKGVSEVHTPSNPAKRVFETQLDGSPLKTKTIHEFTTEPNDVAMKQRSYWAGLFAPDRCFQPLDATEVERGALALKWSAWLLGLSAMALLFSACVGVNTFSLQKMYSYRLIRCYLGASRPKDQTDVPQGAKTNAQGEVRRANPITGFDPFDDFGLNELAKRPVGPYLLVNTAMNLVQDSDLAWQERKAGAFVISPHFAGSRISGYRPLPEYGGGALPGKALTLGEAVSISGAAASPNMGYHSSPAVTALLTVFNVRLGAWMANPAKECWTLREPRMSLTLLVSELLGLTNRRSRFVYLSDGGHFENLGVYELVRRHCRFIVASDAGADPNYDFYDLGGLVRKCRIDLGVPIEIDVTPIKLGADGRSNWHCAVGLIRYDCVDSKAIPGILVYVKSSLSGNEPSDVANYAHEHPTFPHEPTADQFFSESQFESYRELGQHVASEVFSDGMRDVEWTDEMNAEAHRKVVEPLFSNLHRRWFPPPPKLEENYLESVKSCLEMVVELRKDPNLRELSASMFPELEQSLTDTANKPAAAGTVDKPDRARAELHMIEQILEVMETAWLSVHLEGSQTHPMNRGWMNAFRRWGSSAVVRKHWRMLRGEYSQDFVRFCEDELKLDRGQVHAYPLDHCGRLEQSSEWITMQKEFSAEWPAERPLGLRMSDVTSVTECDMEIRAAWVISTAGFNDPSPGRWTNDRFPYGVIFVTGSPGAAEFELFIWIRGAYRNQGVGRECLEDFFPRLLTQLSTPGRLPAFRVRLPEANRPGSPNTSQKGIWLSLFYKYGFRSDDDTRRNSEDLMLLRDT